MTVKIGLSNIVSRLFLLASLIAVCAFLIYAIFQNFITGSFGDSRRRFDRVALSHALEEFPDSARLNYRLAQAEMAEIKGDLANAEQHADKSSRIQLVCFIYNGLMVPLRKVEIRNFVL